MDKVSYIKDSQSELIVPRIKDKKFKINFLWIVIICIMIMCLDQVMNFLDDLPEIFQGGDYIFRTLKSIINISSQLAVSFVSAVLFYYVVEFINAKKKIKDFTEIRKHIIFILYCHMNILCNIKSFKNLNKDEERLKDIYKIFLIIDIPILLNDYNSSNENNIKVELERYFFESGKNHKEKMILVKRIKMFQKSVEALLKYKEVSIYKGYKYELEDLEEIYENLQMKINNYEEENVADLILDDIVENYMYFLHESINIFKYFQRYILCIKNKYFIEFLKMMD